MSVGSPGTFVPLTALGEIREARKHIKKALEKMSTGRRKENLEESYRELGRALMGWKESKYV